MGRLWAAISDGYMSNARDLEEEDVDLRRNKILKGRPRGATSRYGNPPVGILVSPYENLGGAGGIGDGGNAHRMLSANHASRNTPGMSVPDSGNVVRAGLLLLLEGAPLRVTAS